MPAKSKNQQQFFGLVKSIQDGKTEGSGKAKEVAESMSKKDVSDFAATKTKGLPETKKEAADPDIKDLLKYVLASTAAGTGAAGLYYLTKQLTDSKNLREKRIKKYEKRLSIPRSRKIERPEGKSSPTISAEKMLSDADKDLSEISPELQDQMLDPYKSSQFKQADMVPAFLKGVATPAAMLLPGVASYLVLKTIIDSDRRDTLDEELAKAKKEFESVLSKTSNDLQVSIDSLSEKSAGIIDIINGLTDRFYGNTVPVEIPEPAPSPSPSSAVDYIPYGLGLLGGTGAVLGAMLIHSKMKKDPEEEQRKQLQALLKRQISAQSINAPLDIESDNSGFKFKV